MMAATSSNRCRLPWRTCPIATEIRFEALRHLPGPTSKKRGRATMPAPDE